MILLGAISLVGAVVAQSDDESVNLLQTGVGQKCFGTCRVYYPDYDWDKTCWTEKNSYYVTQAHGSTAECYPTLKEAMDKCDAATDCGAVATQSNVGNGCYRVTHGGPTWAIWSDWQRYSLRSWARNGGAGQGACVPPTTTTTAPPTTTTIATTAAPTTAAPTTAAPPSPGPGDIENGKCVGTEDISDGTDEYDSPCFDADTGFGPDFSCATTEMWCGNDSGDGLVVGQCCPQKCKKECESKNKKGNEESRKKSERERKGKRSADEGARKKAEKDRKSQKKQDEWTKKRDAKREKNEKAEDGRKEQRRWDEKKKKKERKWKQGRENRKKNASKRERARKKERSKKEGRNKGGQNNKKKEKAKKQKRKQKKEKRLKREATKKKR